MNKRRICFIGVMALSMSACTDLSLDTQHNCGNGVVDFDEQCDDGNTNNNDGCSADCKIEDGYSCSTESAPSACSLNCGNGTVDFGEQCDLGNLNGQHKGCTGKCEIEEGYACDNASGKSNCSLKCGNGTVDFGEQCDDGNTVSGDGCSSICQIEDGYSCTPDVEPSHCLPNCGNGKLDFGEQCDDNNTKDGDGCSSICQIEDGYSCIPDAEPSECLPNCGNGKLDFGEQCDDGNTENEDGCSSICQIEDGYFCDNTSDESKCSLNCGNSKLDFGEQCDLGSQNGLAGCTSECKAAPGYRCIDNKCQTIRCNDGILDEGEQCDDGNATAGDGCDPGCRIEPFYECDETGCRTICGDGIKLPDEECDDGNNIDGDGCSSECKVETATHTCNQYNNKVNLTEAELIPGGKRNIIPVETVQRDFLTKEDFNYYSGKMSNFPPDINKFIDEILKDSECHSENDSFFSKLANACKYNLNDIYSTKFPFSPDLSCKSGIPGMLMDKLKDNKPVYNTGSGEAICSKTFNTLFSDTALSRSETQYLLFVEIKDEDEKEECDDIYNSNHPNVKCMNRYAFSSYENRDNTTIKLNDYISVTNNIFSLYVDGDSNFNHFNGDYTPLLGRGYFSNIQPPEGSERHNYDAFTSELTGYVKLGASDSDYKINSDDDCWVFVNNRLIIDYGGSHTNQLYHFYNLKENMVEKEFIDKDGNVVKARYSEKVDGYEGTLYPVKVFYMNRKGDAKLHVVIPDLINLGKSYCFANESN